MLKRVRRPTLYVMRKVAGKTKHDFTLNFCFSITQIVYDDTDTDRDQDFNGVIIEVTNSLSDDVT